MAATLRGSAAKNVMQANLNNLSTYGILKEMRQDDLLVLVEALIAVKCLRVSRGEYPTVSITELGERVMRELEEIELPLPEDKFRQYEEGPPPSTAMQSYALFCQGLSVDEIAAQRKLVKSTIEAHLLDCMQTGFAVDTARLVSEADRLLIEEAMAAQGPVKFKILLESLPEGITYNMIRFVVASRPNPEG